MACWSGSIRSIRARPARRSTRCCATSPRRGPWVSAHPDVILKMGIKEVLYRTRHLGWGTDTHLYRTAGRVRRGVSRRGCGRPARACSSRTAAMAGRACGRSKLVPARRTTVRVLHALRGSVPEELPLRRFHEPLRGLFRRGGCIIDQPFQPRLPDGMIRCYMGADKVVGFGHQLIKALIPPPPEGPDSPAAQPGPRIMHGPDAAPFQALRAQNGNRMDAADDGSCSSIERGVAADHLGRRFSLRTARLRPATTPTCCARSMSARASRSRTKRRPRSPGVCSIAAD